MKREASMSPEECLLVAKAPSLQWGAFSLARTL